MKKSIEEWNYYDTKGNLIRIKDSFGCKIL